MYYYCFLTVGQSALFRWFLTNNVCSFTLLFPVVCCVSGTLLRIVVHLICDMLIVLAFDCFYGYVCHNDKHVNKVECKHFDVN